MLVIVRVVVIRGFSSAWFVFWISGSGSAVGDANPPVHETSGIVFAGVAMGVTMLTFCPVSLVMLEFVQAAPARYDLCHLGVGRRFMAMQRRLHLRQCPINFGIWGTCQRGLRPVSLSACRMPS